jgi:hypothetical protein
VGSPPTGGELTLISGGSLPKGGTFLPLANAPGSQQFVKEQKRGKRILKIHRNISMYLFIFVPAKQKSRYGQ